MNKEELRTRTKQFALRVMKLVDALPRRRSANAVGNQLIRAGTAVGANYRAACRARSDAEFAAKIGVVVEESDESAYWLELITDGEVLPEPRVGPLLSEANELLKIFSAAHATLRRKKFRESRNSGFQESTKSRNPEIPKSQNSP